MRVNFLNVLFLLSFLMISNAYANDSFDTADSISVGAIVEASIGTQGDVDFYQFAVSSTSTFYFFSRGVTTNVRGQLFNANQQSIESDSNDGEGDNFRIVEVLSPGTYFLMVSGESSFSTVGDYAIHIEGPGQATLTDGDGFSPWSASNANIGQTEDSEIDQVGDIDYFQFTVESTATYYLFSSGITDVRGRLLNANLQSLESDSSDGEGDNFRIVEILSPGIYYLEVSGERSFSTFGDYVVHIEGPGQATVTDNDGFSPWSASNINVGQITNSVIDQVGDIDYFQFTVESTATYYLFSSGITDVRGRLLNANLQSLESDSSDGEGDNFRIVEILSPGIYYLEVSGERSFATVGSYAVHIEGPGQATETDDDGFSPWSASKINVGQIDNSALELAGDIDYFEFTVQDTARYAIFSRGITNTVAALFNDNLQRLQSDSNDGEGGNFRIIQILSPGTYYLAVSGESSFSTIGGYAVHIEGPRKGTVSDRHGFSPWSAFPVPVPSNRNGELELTGDIDYFAFQVNDTGVVQIFTDGITDTFGVLYDADFNSIESDSNGGEGGNFRIERTLSPGTYHIAISGQSSFSTLGPYVVSIRGGAAEPPVIGPIPAPRPEPIDVVITPIIQLLLLE